MEYKIKRLERNLVKHGAILDIYTDKMQLPNGEVEIWDYIEHRMGAAAVVPVVEEGRVLMVHQYRPALERKTLEIPAGSRDSLTEDTMVCAKRELEEEAGYLAGKMTKILSLKTTVAFCNESIDVYLAEDLTPTQQHLDAAEEIEAEVFSIEELVEKIYAGEIQDGKTVAGLLAYQNLLHQK